MAFSVEPTTTDWLNNERQTISSNQLFGNTRFNIIEHETFNSSDASAIQIQAVDRSSEIAGIEDIIPRQNVASIFSFVSLLSISSSQSMHRNQSSLIALSQNARYSNRSSISKPRREYSQISLSSSQQLHSPQAMKTPTYSHELT